MTDSTRPAPREVSESSPFAGDKMHFCFPSRLEYLSVVDKLVEGIAEVLELDEDNSIALVTSAIEACTNAIQHGHGYDASKIFCFTIVFNSEQVSLSVKDLGEGFDYHKAMSADPTDPEALLKSRGRGIFIMRSMMDKVEFTVEGKGGTTVELVKYLNSGSREAGDEA